uniref:hypothetical protein n=1 Tax=Streptococcus sobrinus TaxID=1310 RepID=UPI0005174834
GLDPNLNSNYITGQTIVVDGGVQFYCYLGVLNELENLVLSLELELTFPAFLYSSVIRPLSTFNLFML